MSGRIDNDAVLHAVLRQLNVELENEHVILHGKMPGEVHADHAKARAEHLADISLGKIVPSYDEIKAAVNGDIAGLIVKKTKAAAVQALEKRVGPVPPPVLAGIATIQAALKTIQEGKEIHESLVRVNGYLATAALCGESMPDGFIAAKNAAIPSQYRPDRFSFRSGVPRGAEVALTALNRMPDEVKEAFFASCREGQVVALTGGARHPEEVDLLLRRDDIRQRYETDTAFRVGFDSARWALEHKKADTLRSKLGILDRSEAAIPHRG